ncbi:MAG: type II toxin-antitoxin system VapC family toxin, partial [Thermoleophilia bacterium]|nr:type II toxin-antitoxin system VapC family toxin [Gaiellaceae bacterium]MDW8339496.1 type II toxin-antitoxin system VapC family toxin [Thermoleophilia bacterium]
GRRAGVTVLDTYAWLWWVDGDPRLSDRARSAIDASDKLLVSAISVWELATLERIGRLKLISDTRVWIRRALAQPRVVPTAVTPEVALTAGSLLPPFTEDPADRIIYATALAKDTRPVTGDPRIARYDRERVVW